MDIKTFKLACVKGKIAQVRISPYRRGWYIEVKIKLHGDFEILTCYHNNQPFIFGTEYSAITYVYGCGYGGDIVAGVYPDFQMCFSLSDIYVQLFGTRLQDTKIHPKRTIRRMLSNLNLSNLGYYMDYATRETIISLYNRHQYYTRSVNWTLIRLLMAENERVYDIACAGVPFC